MTTGQVFGNSSISNRPEFAGIDPRVNTPQEVPVTNYADEQLKLAVEKAKLLQDAISKFMNKEITKAELEIITESLK